MLALLAGEWEKSKITPNLLNRLEEMMVENPFLFVHEMKERLQAEGVCGEISDVTLANALRQMDGRKLIMLMREKARKKASKVFMDAGYMIERLFQIIEELFTKVAEGTKKRTLKRGVWDLKIYSTKHRAGPTEKDTYYLAPTYS